MIQKQLFSSVLPKIDRTKTFNEICLQKWWNCFHLTGDRCWICPLKKWCLVSCIWSSLNGRVVLHHFRGFYCVPILARFSYFEESSSCLQYTFDSIERILIFGTFRNDLKNGKKNYRSSKLLTSRISPDINASTFCQEIIVLQLQSFFNEHSISDQHRYACRSVDSIENSSVGNTIKHPLDNFS